MYKPLKNLQDLGSFTIDDRDLVKREQVLLRERAEGGYNPLSRVVLPKPARLNACYYVVEKNTVQVRLGYRYANTSSSRAFFEESVESFQISVPSGSRVGLVEQIRFALRLRSINAVILSNPRNPSSVVGHSFNH